MIAGQLVVGPCLDCLDAVAGEVQLVAEVIADLRAEGRMEAQVAAYCSEISALLL